MAYLNRAQICGRMGKDPEIRSIERGRVANFSVATSKKWTAKDGSKQEKTEWHSISTFNENTISFLERFCKKGDLVLVEGEIQYRKYTDKSGLEKTAAEILIGGAGFVQNLSPKQSQSGELEDELDRTLKPKTNLEMTPAQAAKINAMLSAKPKQAQTVSDSDDIPF